MRNIFRNRTSVLLLAILLLPFNVYSQEKDVSKCDLERSSDEQIVGVLASIDETKVTQAVDEVIRRGARLIPLLMKHKSNRQCFYGIVKLGNWGTGTVMRFPNDSRSCSNDENTVTVEVAAMFLISAIFHDDLEFAPPPALCDYVKGQDDDRCVESGNSHARVAKAWAAVEQWVKELEKKGIESLRATKSDPLSNSGVAFD